MKEYGGYIELDTYYRKEYHPDALSLNSARTALRFLIRIRGIKKLYLPAFCCSTVWEACRDEGISWEFYSVDSRFRPDFRKIPAEGEWLYIVNLYGTLTDSELEHYARTYLRVIADYTHAFFRRPLPTVDTLYSCRKFFGVPDGAYLSLGEDKENSEALALYRALPLDISCERMHFLLGRYEQPASKFYGEYAENNELFSHEPIKQMSVLTHNLLRGIDYDRAYKRRTDNFAALHDTLGKWNRLKLPEIRGAYAYPFWPDSDLNNHEAYSGKTLRKMLIEQHIYIPVLWPEVITQEASGPEERRMAENILPLPIDQRYTEIDMLEILSVLTGCMLSYV